MNALKRGERGAETTLIQPGALIESMQAELQRTSGAEKTVGPPAQEWLGKVVTVRRPAPRQIEAERDKWGYFNPMYTAWVRSGVHMTGKMGDTPLVNNPTAFTGVLRGLSLEGDVQIDLFCEEYDPDSAVNLSIFSVFERRRDSSLILPRLAVEAVTA